jgi:hypothetical protein
MTGSTARISALVLLLASGLSAQQPGSTPGRQEPPLVLPGTPAKAFITVQGNALDSTNRALPEAAVRLRDARAGRIVAAQLTDKSGLFSFRTVDPGSYVVELVSVQNRAVLAASELLSVDAGQSVTTVVRLPSRVPPAGGLLGRNAAQAAVITAAAAATGVLTRAATTPVSCEQLPCRQ